MVVDSSPTNPTTLSVESRQDTCYDDVTVIESIFAAMVMTISFHMRAG